MTDTTNKVEKKNLVFTRVFDAPVEEVWKAWSDAQYMMQWWGPNGFSCPIAKMDFREGGSSLVCMRASEEFGGQDTYNLWTYKTIVPMTQIEYILTFSDKDGNKVDPVKLGLPADIPQDVRHLITVKAVGNKTELTVTEYDWTVGHMMEMSKMGMEQCLDKMAAIFAGS